MNSVFKLRVLVVFMILALLFPLAARGENISELQQRLNKDYSEYAKGKSRMYFIYVVENFDSATDLEMLLERQSESRHSLWTYRDKKHFNAFLGSVCSIVMDDTGRDVHVFVKDREGRDLGQFEYTVKDRQVKKKTLGFSKFNRSLRADYPLTSGRLEKMLADAYGKYYDDDDYRTLFEYTVVKARKKIILQMKGDTIGKRYA